MSVSWAAASGPSVSAGSNWAAAVPLYLFRQGFATDNIAAFEVVLANSSAVVFWSYRPQLKQTVIIKGLVDVGGQPSPPIFDGFLSIPGNTSGSSVVTNMSTVALGTKAAGYR